MSLQTRLSSVLQAAAAGLLAGAFVGLGEVVLLVLLTGNAANLQGLLWAVLAYGLLGLLAGLGLGIVRNIIEAHGGSVRIENRPDGGARVTIRLPIDEE